MMGRKERPCAPLCNRSIANRVPADHFYRHLDAQLDLAFVRELVADGSAGGGRPAIDPVVFFRLQLVMFFEGLRSERQLMRGAAARLSLRWYLGDDLDEALPHQSRLPRIRERDGLAIFPRCCERVVDLCQGARLVWGEDRCCAAPEVRANADLDQRVPRFDGRAKRHLDDRFAAGPASPAEAGAHEPDPGGTPPGDTPAPAEEPAWAHLPPRGWPGAEARLAAANPANRQVLAAHRLDPDRPGSGSYQRLRDRRGSATDPDAARLSDGRQAALGDPDHYGADGGQARIILAALVTPADVRGHTPRRGLLGRVRCRWQLPPNRAGGDTPSGPVETSRP